KQLLDPALDPRSAKAANLLRRWNRLHAVRTILSAAAFGLLLWSVASHGNRASHVHSMARPNFSYTKTESQNAFVGAPTLSYKLFVSNLMALAKEEFEKHLDICAVIVNYNSMTRIRPSGESNMKSHRFMLIMLTAVLMSFCTAAFAQSDTQKSI